MRSVQKQWDSYRAAVVPTQASPVQVQECRRAFYAGAQVMLAYMTELGGTHISEEAGIEIIQGFHDEMQGFIEQECAG